MTGSHGVRYVTNNSFLAFFEEAAKLKQGNMGMVYAVRVRASDNTKTLVEFSNYKALERASVDFGSDYVFRAISRQNAYAWVAQSKDNETGLTVEDVTQFS